MPCPYGTLFLDDYYYSVHMIRHDDEFIQFNMWKMIRYPAPALINDFSRFIQTHRPIDNLSEHTITVERIGTNKIPTLAGIIITLQSDRTAVVPVRIVNQNALGESVGTSSSGAIMVYASSQIMNHLEACTPCTSKLCWRDI